MEKIWIDMTQETKVSVIKAKAREVLVEAFMEFLEERAEKFGKVASDKIAVAVGVANDLDGFPNDIPVVVDFSAKSWYDKEDLKRPVVRYDIDDEIKAYEDEVAAKKAPKK